MSIKQNKQSSLQKRFWRGRCAFWWSCFIMHFRCSAECAFRASSMIVNWSGNKTKNRHMETQKRVVMHLNSKQDFQRIIQRIVNSRLPAFPYCLKTWLFSLQKFVRDLFRMLCLISVIFFNCERIPTWLYVTRFLHGKINVKGHENDLPEEQRNWSLLLEITSFTIQFLFVSHWQQSQCLKIVR